MDAGEVRDIGGTERRKRHHYFLPRVRLGREAHPRITRRTSDVDANRLPAGGSAVEPKRDICVNGSVNRIVGQIPGLPAAAGHDAHAVRAAMNRIIGPIMRHPAPVAPAIVQPIGKDQHIVTAPGLPCPSQRRCKK